MLEDLFLHFASDSHGTYSANMGYNTPRGRYKPMEIGAIVGGERRVFTVNTLDELIALFPRYDVSMVLMYCMTAFQTLEELKASQLSEARKLELLFDSYQEFERGFQNHVQEQYPETNLPA